MFTLNFNLRGVTDLTSIEERMDKMALNLSDLQREVAENGEVIASASALIASLAQEIRENAGNQAALNELANRLDQNSRGLAEAVALNTDSDDEVETTEPTPIVGEPTDNVASDTTNGS